MKNIGVFFGSRAAEHDVSIISGLQLLENIDKSKYNAFPVYVSREGEWFTGEPLRDIKLYRNFNPKTKGLTKVILPPVPGVNGLCSVGEGLFGKFQMICPLDAAILSFHGMHGEDGTVQGLFELADIPYSSCGVVASALGMDKILMKAAFKSIGLPVLDSVWCTRDEWEKAPSEIDKKASALGYPVYVKPANLGSSIGISRAEDSEGLARGIELASQFDSRILIEKGLEKPAEINCACLGYGDDVTPSLCEEPVSLEEFLTFDEKYMRGGGKGMDNLARKVPAPIGDELTKRIQSYTATIFRTFGCKGVVRVDYMLDRASDELYVCEINTIPGSFAFYLFEPMGISFPALADKLIDCAIKALEDKKACTYAYSSGILEKARGGTKAK